MKADSLYRTWNKHVEPVSTESQRIYKTAGYHPPSEFREVSVERGSSNAVKEWNQTLRQKYGKDWRQYKKKFRIRRVR